MRLIHILLASIPISPNKSAPSALLALVILEYLTTINIYLLICTLRAALVVSTKT